MAWKNAVVTDKGIALLQRVLGGEILSLDHAAGGTGTVADSSLKAQTTLKNQKQMLTIVGTSANGNSKKINVQITSTGLPSGYTLQQLGIWAHVGSDPPVLFALLQDSIGVSIPSQIEIQDFSLNFFAIIDFSNEADFQLTVDPSTVVTITTLNSTIEELRKKFLEQNLITKADIDALDDIYPLDPSTPTGDTSTPITNEEIDNLFN